MSNKSQKFVQGLFNKSVAHMQTGNMSAACQGFSKLTRALPDSAVVWYNLGLCHQHLGEHARAIEAYRKTVKIAPTQVDGWVNLGISQLELGDPKSAATSSEKALQIAPQHPRALNLSGSILADSGEIEEARARIRQSLSADPSNADAASNLAAVELLSGNNEEARTLIDNLLQQFPEKKDYLVLKSRLLLNTRAYAEAAPIILGMEEQYGDDEDVMRLNLSYREALRDHFGAITVCEKLLKKFPKDASVYNSLGGAFFQLDGIEKSRTFYEKALFLDPDNAEYENNLGLAFSSLGDKENAEKHYRKSLELNPMHAEAYRNIATMKRFKSIDDPDAQDVIKLWETAELDDFLRTKAAFALGKIYDDCGLYDKAFEVYKVGNDIKFRDSRIDLDAYLRHIDSVPEILGAPPINISGLELSPRPVFVLGMPRSGTTLVEQVLSRHSAVEGFGELPCIERAITRLEKRAQPMRAYPADFWSIESDEIERESREYLHWVNRLHDTKTDFFTDKMPFNFVHVWLIKALFPESPIVHCRRHPLDVITSNYFQLYGSDISFVYNLDALTQYYIRYDRVMKHWSKVFGDDIYDVVYERFVADSESETRNLIEAVNLEWEDGCLDAGASGTAVRTASIWQVREGIYTSSRERWRNYESYLKSVIHTLAEQNILDPDGNWISQ